MQQNIDLFFLNNIHRFNKFSELVFVEDSIWIFVNSLKQIGEFEKESLVLLKLEV